MDKRKISGCMRIVTLDILRLFIVLVTIFIIGAHSMVINMDTDSTYASKDVVKVELLSTNR